MYQEFRGADLDGNSENEVSLERTEQPFAFFFFFFPKYARESSCPGDGMTAENCKVGPTLERERS